MNIPLKCGLLGIASSIQGFAMAVFLFPHYIPSGGAACISVLFNYLFHTPYSVTLWLLNAGLLMAGVKWLGKNRMLWTLYCVSISAFVVDIITPHMTQPLSNVIFDLIIGSIIFGIALGILFRYGSSSGGMDILALIISKFTGLLPGKILFWINGTILLITGAVVDLKIILYAVICQFIGTHVLDFVLKFHVKARLYDGNYVKK